jgi:hypothetical protein
MTMQSMPEPRGLFGPLRAVETAKTTLRELPDGRFEAAISHAPLEGVTPEMILWYLRNMGREMTFRGERLLAYLWWHPYDHIHLDVVQCCPDGTVGPGARFHIQEAFGREERYRVNEMVDVPRLDVGGITLEQRLFGQVIFSLQHRFTPLATGTQYDSVMLLGSDTWWLKGVAKMVRKRKFGVEKQTRWLQHNVEEVGYFEHFLADLYGQEAIKEGAG